MLIEHKLSPWIIFCQICKKKLSLKDIFWVQISKNKIDQHHFDNPWDWSSMTIRLMTISDALFFCVPYWKQQFYFIQGQMSNKIQFKKKSGSMSMFMKAIKKPVASSETENCLIIAKNRTFRFRCVSHVFASTYIHLTWFIWKKNFHTIPHLFAAF